MKINMLIVALAQGRKGESKIGYGEASEESIYIHYLSCNIDGFMGINIRQTFKIVHFVC